LHLNESKPKTSAFKTKIETMNRDELKKIYFGATTGDSKGRDPNSQVLVPGLTLGSSQKFRLRC